MLIVAVKHLIYEHCINLIFRSITKNFALVPDNFIEFIENRVKIDFENGEINEDVFLPVTGEYEYSYLMELYKQYYGHYADIDPITYRDKLRTPFAHLLRTLMEIFSDDYRQGVIALNNEIT